MKERLHATTLLFPALTEASKEYFHDACQRDEPVVAASSVPDHEAERIFGEVVGLPFVYAPEFEDEFLNLVRSRNVARIYAPVASVYTFLEGFIADRKLPIRLIGKSPIRRQVDAYRELMAKAASYRPLIVSCAEGGRPALSPLQTAAAFRQAALIYGESNDEKLAAMMGVFASAPQGDVVEIGSLMGRSAFVLKFLATSYRIGAVLSVDPISATCAVQVDSPDVVRSDLVGEWDYEILRAAFAINMLPFGDEGFNYLRLPSAEAAEVYRAQSHIESPEFGSVTYRREIAVIHIDGNHDYAQVRQDCELWLQWLVPGAWVILDDYVWAHGDGPHRVGDALLKAHEKRIDRAFVCGKALFIKYGT